MSGVRIIARPLTWLATGVLLLATGVPVAAANSGEWEYEASIYGFLPKITGSTITGGDLDISQRDLLDGLNMYFGGNVEARHGKWSILGDMIYMSVGTEDGGSEQVPVGPIEIPVKTNLGVGLKAFILTMAGGYNVISTDKATLDVIAGARYFKLETNLKLNLTTPGPVVGPIKRKRSESGHVWDGIVGVKGQVKLNENWYMPFYADVGAGNSDLTWQIEGGVGYKFDWGDTYLVYRYLSYDLPSDRLIQDLKIKGPQLGVKFYF